MKASFKVRQDLTFWSNGVEKFAPGEGHEFQGSADEMLTIRDAGNAGVLYDVVIDGELPPAETDEESIAKLDYTGPWLEGNQADATQ